MLDVLNQVAALSWDPQIRGILIVAAAVIMLPGTVYLLLATNVGARMGFLMAIAGITGFTMLLGITWAFYGQGMKGRDPSWKVREVVQSAAPTDLTAATTASLDDFPDGWNKLPDEGSRILGDAAAAVDNFITKSGRKPKIGHAGPIIKEPTPEQIRWPAQFATSDEYVMLGGYNKGGGDSLFTIGGHKFYLTQSAHYVTVNLRPAVANPPAPDGTITYSREPDTSKPVTSVVVIRDRGSVRFPQVMITLASAIIFLVTCHALHRRDKQIMAARAAGLTPATA